MAEQTIRYFAGSRIPYARAVLALVKLAREPRQKFSFGPMALDEMLDSGLAVSGEHLADAERELDQVEGLTRWE